MNYVVVCDVHNQYPTDPNNVHHIIILPFVVNRTFLLVHQERLLGEVRVVGTGEIHVTCNVM